MYIYTEGRSGQGTQLVGIAVGQVDGPVLIGVPQADGVHHGGDAFVQTGRAHVGEGEGQAENVRFGDGQNDSSLFHPIDGPVQQSLLIDRLFFHDVERFQFKSLQVVIITVI